ncbi:hypothetical protein GQ54DRAFT_199756 [Martensiomyces pterosporus]|nr:hypothetical protein GQ54DRAFT_199756 [Martensiomyces pterosporus]
MCRPLRRRNCLAMLDSLDSAFTVTHSPGSKYLASILALARLRACARILALWMAACSMGICWQSSTTKRPKTISAGVALMAAGCVQAWAATMRGMCLDYPLSSGTSKNARLRLALNFFTTVSATSDCGWWREERCQTPRRHVVSPKVYPDKDNREDENEDKELEERFWIVRPSHRAA